MAKTETLHIRVNETVKLNAEEILNRLGISISEAVNMFLCQVDLTGGLPFEVKLPMSDRLIVKDMEDLRQKLCQAEKNIEEGKVCDAEDVMDRLREKYGI
ncbi:MAG: type II toxin-antitoxin system RelB/DinJ family antitoxin [Ruminococcaceae bacterium]|nr:type II toxin-antitoxin system RelB/DinJ family antitoxin [Oscillospiraceae bacterium]